MITGDIAGITGVITGDITGDVTVVSISGIFDTEAISNGDVD